MPDKPEEFDGLTPEEFETVMRALDSPFAPLGVGKPGLTEEDIIRYLAGEIPPGSDEERTLLDAIARDDRLQARVERLKKVCDEAFEPESFAAFEAQVAASIQEPLPVPQDRMNKEASVACPAPEPQESSKPSPRSVPFRFYDLHWEAIESGLGYEVMLFSRESPEDQDAINSSVSVFESACAAKGSVGVLSFRVALPRQLGGGDVDLQFSASVATNPCAAAQTECLALANRALCLRSGGQDLLELSFNEPREGKLMQLRELTREELARCLAAFRAGSVKIVVR